MKIVLQKGTTIVDGSSTIVELQTALTTSLSPITLTTCEKQVGRAGARIVNDILLVPVDGKCFAKSLTVF